MNKSDGQIKPKILLIVEDLAQMEYLVNLLYRNAYTVHAVQRVDEACDSLVVAAPDLIVIDLPPTQDAEKALSRFIDGEPELAGLKILALGHPGEEQVPDPHGRIVRTSKGDDYLGRIAELLDEAGGVRSSPSREGR
jgi:CheY-like chemotaxis protein